MNNSDLSFVEHWDLDEHDREIGGARFDVILERFIFVTLFRFFPEELDEDDDDSHVEPFHEQHE